MRYNNTLHTIESTNLNNSLAFYHALFNRMPDVLDENSMLFHMEAFSLLVQETSVATPLSQGELNFQIQQKEELIAVNDRMRRFRAIAQMNNHCEVLDEAFGLMDPDGNKWVVGDPRKKVQFEKCYINN